MVSVENRLRVNQEVEVDPEFIMIWEIITNSRNLLLDLSKFLCDIAYF
jgi:hypothetical protein